jgi:hypothetical protein
MNPKKKIWQSEVPAQTPSPRPGKPVSSHQRAELELVLKKAQALALKNPDKAAIILSTWLGAKNLKKAA